ncbi:hypothetical protein PMN64_34180 [Bradyrhizobium sp. UFLA01-814]|uniref:acyl-CoA dehydrogenase family protein n=1 Tax=Bradyrhizobium sp. UFLA01-814 TaxID=3023480 RepID=UPI00398BB48E
MYAAMMAADGDATERARAISVAKIQIGRSAKAIGREAVQLYGATSVTISSMCL